MDETCITTVQTLQKILCDTGWRSAGDVTSAEKGHLVTLACTINAAGNTVPPLLIFSRVKYHRKFINGAPVGSIGAVNKSDWINEDIFSFLEHFVCHSRCSLEKKILLLLDNHAANGSLTAVKFCHDHGIILLTILPKTSHKLQPLDVAVYDPFKKYYANGINAWHRNHHGQTMNIYNIPAVVNSASIKAFTPSNITNGFYACGIVPIRTYFPTVTIAQAMFLTVPNQQ